jgi:hypothetical protein
MSIVTTIARSRYRATGEQIQQLARGVVAGKRAAGTYLRVLVAACKTQLNGKQRMTQRKAIDVTHARFYPHVQKGVGEAGTAKERNRRCTFARTAASTLRGFVKAGGDIRSLEPGEVTKASLRAHGQPVPVGTRQEQSFDRSHGAILRAAALLAETSPSAARKRIERAITALQKVADELPKTNGHRHTRRAPAVTRQGQEAATSPATH